MRIEYYYILSIDGYADAKGSWVLRSPGKGWEKTESYNEPEYEGGTPFHRKFVKHVTTLAGLRRILDDYNLHSGPEQTGGALTGLGLLPAIGFSGEIEQDGGGPAWTSLYVGIMADSERAFKKAEKRIAKIHKDTF